jgi:hypothetical protein
VLSARATADEPMINPDVSRAVAIIFFDFILLTP